MINQEEEEDFLSLTSGGGTGWRRPGVCIEGRRKNIQQSFSLKDITNPQRNAKDNGKNQLHFRSLRVNAFAKNDLAGVERGS